MRRGCLGLNVGLHQQSAKLDELIAPDALADGEGYVGSEGVCKRHDATRDGRVRSDETRLTPRWRRLTCKAKASRVYSRRPGRATGGGERVSWCLRRLLRHHSPQYGRQLINDPLGDGGGDPGFGVVLHCRSRDSCRRRWRRRTAVGGGRELSRWSGVGTGACCSGPARWARSWHLETKNRPCISKCETRQVGNGLALWQAYARRPEW